MNRSLSDWFIKVQTHWVNLQNRIIIKLAPVDQLYMLHMLQLRMVGLWFLDQNVRARQMQGKPLALLDLLASSFASFSTDPRDKIYGLLGLASDFDSGTYKVDYLTTERSLLQYFVQHYIESTKRLDVLCYASFHKGLPTWVPYWGPIPLTDLSHFASNIPSYL